MLKNRFLTLTFKRSKSAILFGLQNFDRYYFTNVLPDSYRLELLVKIAWTGSQDLITRKKLPEQEARTWLLVKIAWTGSQDLIYVTGKKLVNWRPTTAVHKRPKPQKKIRMGAK